MRIYDNPACFDRYAVILPGVILIGSPCLKVAYQDDGKERPDGKPLGKKISISELSGLFKERICNNIPIPNFRLPKLPTKYGAPIGRPNTATGKCQLGKVHLYDGYDIGGAYWGIGETLYCAKSKNSISDWSEGILAKPGFSFVRARSAYKAVQKFEEMGLTF